VFAKPYTLNKISADSVELILRVKPSREVSSGSRNTVASLLAIVGLNLGVALIYFLDISNVFASFVAVLLPAAAMGFMAGPLLRARHSHSSIHLNRDHVVTTQGNKVERSDIDRVWSRYDETYLTYDNRLDYWRVRANCRHTKKYENYVGVTCGDMRISLTDRVLRKEDAKQVATAVARWLQDPEALLR
jgi:hypothetical protein